MRCWFGAAADRSALAHRQHRRTATSDRRLSDAARSLRWPSRWLRPPSAVRVAAWTASLQQVSTILASPVWTGVSSRQPASRPLASGSSRDGAWHRKDAVCASSALDPEASLTRWARRCICIPSCADGIKLCALQYMPQLRRLRSQQPRNLWPHAQSMPACGHRSAGGLPWPLRAAFMYWSRVTVGAKNKVLKSLQSKTRWSTQACTNSNTLGKSREVGGRGDDQHEVAPE